MLASSSGDGHLAPKTYSGSERPADRFLVLDSWRGLCALLVAAYHFPFIGQTFALPFIRNSYLFVDLFFVLSGFVICHAYSGKLTTASDVGRFLVRRIGRIWPLHAAVLAAFVLFESARQLAQQDGFGPSRSLGSLADNLLLTHAWGFEQILTWNGPSWSISVELALYIAFALVLWRLPRSLIPISVVAAVSGIAIVGLFSPTYVGATVQYGLPRGLAGFFTGVLVYQLRGGWRPRVTTGGEILTMAAVILFVSWAGAASWAPLFTPLVFGIVVFVFASESGGLSALLSTRFALALGAWSYSIYMVHMLVISAFKVVASQSNMFATHIEGTTTLFRARWPWVADLLLLLYLAIVVAVSAITFRLIEVPAREFFNGIVGHQTKPKVLSPIAG